MKSSRFIWLVLLAAVNVVAAPPPAGFPRTLRGAVIRGATTQPGHAVYQYAASWSDADDGYTFLAPGRPVGWDLITVDVAGLATLGTATADWSTGMLGVPLEDVTSGFAYVPEGGEYGYAFDAAMTGEMVGFGMVMGFAIDMTLVLWRIALGGPLNAARNSVGGRGRSF